MEIKDPYKRLEKFWGKVDGKHIRLITKHITGNKVLDLGCGYGTTTAYISSLPGMECTGVDLDERSIAYCSEKYPGKKFILADAGDLPFEDGTFDTVILRDALHHFYQEADIGLVKKELNRVTKERSRVIFFDPNVNFMLRTMRKIIGHRDAECDYGTALHIMKDTGFRIVHKSFNTLYSLPLSGGYVGIDLVPDIPALYKIILASENILEKAVNAAGFGKNLCWRYLIVGEKK